MNSARSISIKVAVIGCSGIGHAHLNSRKAIEYIEIVGIVDLNEERTKEKR